MYGSVGSVGHCAILCGVKVTVHRSNSIIPPFKCSRPCLCSNLLVRHIMSWSITRIKNLEQVFEVLMIAKREMPPCSDLHVGFRSVRSFSA